MIFLGTIVTVDCIVQMGLIVYFKDKTPSQAPAMACTSICADPVRMGINRILENQNEQTGQNKEEKQDAVMCGSGAFPLPLGPLSPAAAMTSLLPHAYHLWHSFHCLATVLET